MTIPAERPRIPRIFPWIVGAWALGTALWYWLVSSSIAGAYDPLATLVSALAFGGLIETIRLQRQELTETRAEMAGQRIAQENQVAQLARQGSMTTFMALLNAQRVALSSLVAYPAGIDGDPHRGVEAFNWAVGAIDRNLREHPLEGRQVATRVEKLRPLLERVCHSGIGDFDPYFRTLEALVLFTAGLPKGERAILWSMIRSQFAQDELRLLYWWCLAGMGTSAFTSAVTDHRLLWGLRPTEQMKLFVVVLQWDREPLADD